jgi:hypothetical protein
MSATSLKTGSDISIDESPVLRQRIAKDVDEERLSGSARLLPRFSGSSPGSVSRPCAWPRLPGRR